MEGNTFKGIDIPIVKYDVPDFSAMARHANSTMTAVEDSIREKHEREERYKQDTLETLRNIEKNTGDISQLVLLLHDNSEKQTEILEVMMNIMSIGTSTTTEEAESKYRAVMTKITTAFEDAETMEKLLGYSKLIYHSAKELIKHKLENGS